MSDISGGNVTRRLHRRAVCRTRRLEELLRTGYRLGSVYRAQYFLLVATGYRLQATGERVGAYACDGDHAVWRQRPCWGPCVLRTVLGSQTDLPCPWLHGS